MKKIDFPVGISDFSKIRENEYYYIDKTGLICEVLKNPGTEVTLITRPRRFGKTLGDVYKSQVQFCMLRKRWTGNRNWCRTAVQDSLYKTCRTESR